MLEILSVPAAAPAIPGVKRTGSDVDWPGLSVIGKDTPEIEKPLPDTDAALMVRAPVPAEVSVKYCVAVALTTVLPKARVLALRVSPAVVVGFAVMLRAVDTPPDVPVMVAVCAL